jgi:hypothetical protein
MRTAHPEFNGSRKGMGWKMAGKNTEYRHLYLDV